MKISWAQLEEFRRGFVENFPEAEGSFINYVVASEVILNLLGADWWRRNLAGGEAHPYFMKDRPDTKGRYIHQHRVMSLVRHLLACQELSGYESMLEELQERTLPGAAAEASAAYQLHRSGHKVEFVKPTGIKGKDFDLLADGEVAVEVKAKGDNTTYTESSLTSTLRDARQQLPPEGPGVIVVQLPEAWAEEAAFVGDADRIFNGTLRNSRRVNGLIVVWEQWATVSPSGMACVVQFRIYVNERPRSPVRGIREFLTAVGPRVGRV